MHTYQVQRFFGDHTGFIVSTLTYTCPDLEAAMHVLARVRAFLREHQDGTVAGLVVNGCHVPVDQNEVHTGLLGYALAAPIRAQLKREAAANAG